MPKILKRLKRKMLPRRPSVQHVIVMNGKTWYSVPKAASTLGIHWTRVYALVRTDRVKSEKVDGRTFIETDSLKDYRERADWWNSMHAKRTSRAS